ncbi:hypothetical protein NL676_010813 [Syzygium grande]|nr:hypothetical protein NL676_010813 [Syzygium grande]
MRTLIETSALGQHPRLQLPLAPSRHNRASHSRPEVNRALDLRSKARLRPATAAIEVLGRQQPLNPGEGVAIMAGKWKREVGLGSRRALGWPCRA